MKIGDAESQRGFTLAELLIVVAIIAVLVALSMPVFSGQLERAREATDLSNVRSAYAEVMTAALVEDKDAEFNGEAMLQADGSYQASVQLVQEADGWQTDAKDLSIGGVTPTDSAHWVGSPKAKGTCVVKSAGGAVFFYWDGAGGGTGGSGGDGPSTPTPGPNPGKTLTIADVVINVADYPESASDGPFLVTKGTVYFHRGKYFVATTDKGITNEYDYVSPDNADYLFAEVSVNPTVIGDEYFDKPNDSSDRLVSGMVCKLGSALYLNLHYNGWGTKPSGSDGNWLKINTV